MNDRLPSTVVREGVLATFRQRRIITSLYVGIVATALVALVVLPPTYRAASQVLVTSNRAQISTTAEKPTQLLRESQVGETELNSQVEMVRSPELIGGVLRDMGVPDAPPESSHAIVRWLRAVVGTPVRIGRWAYRALHGIDEVPVPPGYWKVKDVLESLDVSIPKGSNVLEIGYQGSDPVWARDFVDRLTSAYVERHAEMQRETAAEGFFTTQSQILRQKLADSEAALRAVREKAGTLSGQQTEVHARLNEFDADLARAKVARAEQEERVSYLQSMRGGRKGGSGLATPELLALEAKRAELVGHYQPDSERMRDIDQQIARLRGAIGTYDQVVGSRDESTDLTAARAALQAIKGREDGVARQRDEYLKKAQLLDAQSFDLVRLERQAKLDEEAYLSYVRAAEQSRLSNAIEQSKMLRLNIVESASVSPEPIGPKTGLILLLAFVGGLVASIGAGIVWDRMDGTVKTADDVRRLAGLEVLALYSSEGAA